VIFEFSRAQMAQLTGQRFLGFYQTDDQQLQALMNNGLTFTNAQNRHLKNKGYLNVEADTEASSVFP
jgi:hypothetical protein